MNPAQPTQRKKRRKTTLKEREGGHFIDLYETLQLSPNADASTIERIFRLLAQQFHPNNQKTGNENAFQRLLAAYRVLIDPERRAAYDADYTAQQRLRWQVFDQSSGAQDKKSVKQIRKGVLSVLYAKRLKDLDHPGMSVLDIEDLTGCPREHLYTAIWYLREKRLVVVADESRYAITALGMDECEMWEEPNSADGDAAPASLAVRPAGDCEVQTPADGAGLDAVRSLQELSVAVLNPTLIPIDHGPRLTTLVDVKPIRAWCGPRKREKAKTSDESSRKNPARSR